MMGVMSHDTTHDTSHVTWHASCFLSKKAYTQFFRQRIQREWWVSCHRTLQKHNITINTPIDTSTTSCHYHDTTRDSTHVSNISCPTWYKSRRMTRVMSFEWESLHTVLVTTNSTGMIGVMSHDTTRDSTHVSNISCPTWHESRHMTRVIFCEGESLHTILWTTNSTIMLDVVSRDTTHVSRHVSHIFSDDMSHATWLDSCFVSENPYTQHPFFNNQYSNKDWCHTKKKSHVQIVGVPHMNESYPSPEKKPTHGALGFNDQFSDNDLCNITWHETWHESCLIFLVIREWVMSHSYMNESCLT